MAEFSLYLVFVSVILALTLLAALLPLLAAGKLDHDPSGFATSFFSISKSVSNGVFTSMVLQLVSHSHMKWTMTVKGEIASTVCLSTQLLGFFLAFFLEVYLHDIVEKKRENRALPVIREEIEIEQKKKEFNEYGKGGPGTLQEKNLNLKIPFKDGSPGGQYVSLSEVDHSKLGIPEGTLVETPSTEFPPDYGTLGAERGLVLSSSFSFTCDEQFEVSDASSPHLRILLLLASVSVHNLFEGLTLGLLDDRGHAISYFVAILLHAILMTAAISVTLITSITINVNKMVMYLAIFCTVRPIGIVIGTLLGHGDSFMSKLISSLGQSLSAGVFLHITFFSMIPGDKALMHDRKGQNVGAFVTGGLGVILLSLVMELLSV